MDEVIAGLRRDWYHSDWYPKGITLKDYQQVDEETKAVAEKWRQESAVIQQMIDAGLWVELPNGRVVPANIL